MSYIEGGSTRRYGLLQTPTLEIGIPAFTWADIGIATARADRSGWGVQVGAVDLGLKMSLDIMLEIYTIPSIGYKWRLYGKKW